MPPVCSGIRNIRENREGSTSLPPRRGGESACSGRDRARSACRRFCRRRRGRPRALARLGVLDRAVAADELVEVVVRSCAGRRWAGHRLPLGDGAALSVSTSDSVGRRSTRRGRGSSIRGGCGLLREILHGTGRCPTRALQVDCHLGGRWAPLCDYRGVRAERVRPPACHCGRGSCDARRRPAGVQAQSPGPGLRREGAGDRQSSWTPSTA